VEHETSGEYDEKKAERIDAILNIARKYGIKVKLTLEHFRNLNDTPPRFAGSVSMGKPIHHVSKGGPVESMTDFFTLEKSRKQFKQKLHWFKDRFGDNTTVFAWELWNEINAVKGEGWLEWTRIMLKELQMLFPENLALQSVGSFDRKDKLDQYKNVWEIPENDIAQVHRYLDLGAELKICHGPVDILAADGIVQVRNLNLSKPVLLAETGAVQPHHAGPSKLYEKDQDGIILHDLIFAPFFAGSAGTGQSWHWTFYIEKQNLWTHFDRFAEVVKDIDPIEQQFKPMMLEHPELRLYVLKGISSILVWCRDKENTWKTELVQGIAPRKCKSLQLDLTTILAGRKIDVVKFYDPWLNEWSEATTKNRNIILPEFKRSIVMKLD
jgi:hypothetical protein